MAKALVITEKPSVARDIVAAMGGFREQDGFWESESWVVTYSVGHLVELLAPEDLDAIYKRWTLDTLPILPAEFRLKPKPGASERVRTIRKLLKRKDIEEVINACDAGREGELIFREIMEYLESPKPVRRLWLQSMTREAIRAGFQRLEPGEDYDGLAAAASCRSQSDWLIGMNATRALTRRLQSRKERAAWSAGRVQTPTLALLVGRELEILAHRPRPYWRIEARFAAPDHEYVGTWFDPQFEAPPHDGDAKEDRIFDETRATAIVTEVGERAAEARETRKPSRESAPPLFDLTSLQRECNRRFSWSARRTLNAAQRCYERHKVLTYPRTDSRCLPTDYRGIVDGVLEALSTTEPYGEAAKRLIGSGLENTARTFDDSGVSDHFAIIPTGELPGEPLGGDDGRLFDLVTRRFLAAFHPPAIWTRVERVTEAAGHAFRSRSRTLDLPGWREVLGQTEQEDQALPPLAPGQTEATGVAVRTLDSETCAEETRPPARINEARLLGLMENAGQSVDDEDLAAVLHDKGLGTPATRADIIENLIQKGYVVRTARGLRPTVKGIRLVDILNRIHVDRLASAALTGDLEFRLREVEKGQRSSKEFMKEMVEYTTEIVDRTRGFDYDALYPDEEPLGTCPCEKRRPVYERAWFYRCLEEPAQEPDEDCSFRVWKDKSGRYLDRATVSTLLEKHETPVLDGFMSRDGRIYRGVLKLEGKEIVLTPVSDGPNDRASDAPEYEVNEAPLGSCPRDHGGKIVETPAHYVCRSDAVTEETPACPFVLPRTVCKREITREEAEAYVRDGRTPMLTEFISRYGRPFAAVLYVKENGRHGFEFAQRKKTTRKKTRKKSPAKKTPRRKAAPSSKASSDAPARKAAPSSKATSDAPRRAAAKSTRKPARKKTTRKKTARKKNAPPRAKPSASEEGS